MALILEISTRGQWLLTDYAKELFLTWIIVSTQAIRAARTNPAQLLRSE